MAGFKFKPIKAKIPNVEKAIKEIDKAADAIGAFMASEFKKTTRTWSAENKPKWKPIKKRSKSRISVEVSTDKKVYGFVSGGTKVRRAYLIKPFSPKTRVGRINSVKGQFSGVVVRKSYNFPGIKAREFDKQIKPIAQKRLRLIGRRINATIRSL